MNLHDAPKKQLQDHIEWLRKVGSNSSTPSQVMWESMCGEFIDHSMFLELFVQRHLTDKGPLDIPTYTNGQPNTEGESFTPDFLAPPRRGKVE
jgi:hypothetical protein